MLAILKSLKRVFITLILYHFIFVVHADGICNMQRLVTPDTEEKISKPFNKKPTYLAKKKQSNKKRQKAAPKAVENQVQSNSDSEEEGIGSRTSCQGRENLVKYCWPIPDQKLVCKIINPSDLALNTCAEFSDKLSQCETYSCQMPYSQDPTVTTRWEIHKKVNDRCLVSSTTTDIGIKDSDGTPLPITQKCEYDETGIQALIKRFNDAERRFFHFSTCEHYEGVFNCKFSSGGKPIKEAQIGQ